MTRPTNPSPAIIRAWPSVSRTTAMNTLNAKSPPSTPLAQGYLTVQSRSESDPLPCPARRSFPAGLEPGASPTDQRITAMNCACLWRLQAVRSACRRVAGVEGRGANQKVRGMQVWPATRHRHRGPVGKPYSEMLLLPRGVYNHLIIKGIYREAQILLTTSN
jgi:hypothetical protein